MAAHVDSPAMVRTLRHIEEREFVKADENLNPESIAVLQRLAELGLVDRGYSDTSDRQPFIWVSNQNGRRVLKLLDATTNGTIPKSKLIVGPLARAVLTSFSENEQLSVLVAAELFAEGTGLWPNEKLVCLGQDEPMYLLRVLPDVEAFVRRFEGNLDLFDIMRAETRRLFLERFRNGSKVG